MQILKPALAIATVALIAACGPRPIPTDTVQLASVADAGQASQPCFFADQVRGFRSVERTTLVLDAGRGRFYQANSEGFCTDLDFATTITIRPESAGTGRLCPGDHARLNVRGSGDNSGQCRVRVIKMLTAEEKSAMESKVS